MTDYSSLNSNEISALCCAFSKINSVEECREFLKDICTVSEVNALSQRLDVAKRLRQGESFNHISAQTGASTATISRVSRCLSKGSGGYDLVLKKMDN